MFQQLMFCFFLIVFTKLRKSPLVVVIPVRPSSLRTQQLGSHWTDFHEIWHLNIFREIVEKVQVSLKPEMNIIFFTRRQIYIFDHISLSSS